MGLKMASVTDSKTITAAGDGILHDNSAPESAVELERLVSRTQDILDPSTLQKIRGLLYKLLNKGKAVAWPLGNGSDTSDDRVVVLEGKFGKYIRDVVAFKETQPGGPLRGIVKVKISFQNRDVEGTGVLIDKSTVLLAGHLLAYRGFKALDVKVVAGLSGGSADVEERRGILAAVHFEWFTRAEWANDIGFIRLNIPFNTVEPLRYRQTPLTENGDIDVRIYGYPEDMPTNAKGRDLCLSKALLSYRASFKVAEHEGDTTYGTSGGPVVDDEGVVIALHMGCVTDDQDVIKVNAAVTIDRRGNNIDKFVSVLDYAVALNFPAGEGALDAEQAGKYAGVKPVGKLPGTNAHIFDWIATGDDV